MEPQQGGPDSPMEQPSFFKELSFDWGSGLGGQDPKPLSFLINKATEQGETDGKEQEE
jgi:hypothetical protein